MRTSSKWTRTRSRGERAGGTGPGITVAGHCEGDIVASLTQVEVMDPIALAKQYPADMPSARDVLDY